MLNISPRIEGNNYDMSFQSFDMWGLTKLGGLNSCKHNCYVMSIFTSKNVSCYVEETHSLIDMRIMHQHSWETCITYKWRNNTFKVRRILVNVINRQWPPPPMKLLPHIHIGLEIKIVHTALSRAMVKCEETGSVFFFFLRADFSEVIC